MKKIMFNDRYGLTQAVLDGRKTMTRRVIKGEFEKVTAYHANGEWRFLADTKDGETIVLEPRYLECEKVAVAQPYKDTDVLSFNAYDNVGAYHLDGLKRHKEMLSSPGYRNKMFVKAEYMPHRIRITDIKVERLQDISEEDCIKEGIEEHYPYIDRNPADKVKSYRFRDKQSKYGYFQLYPVRDCFAVLIDRISGKGTWERNPWVFAYEFELIK